MSIKEEGRNYSNFSGNEIRASKDLKGYRDIVIKEADKGSAVVVWGLKVRKLINSLVKWLFMRELVKILWINYVKRLIGN